MKVRTIKAKKLSTILSRKKNLRKVLHGLLLLVSKKYKQNSLHYGICGEVETALCLNKTPRIPFYFEIEIEPILNTLIKTWPEFSGDESYPVPSYSTRCDEFDAYWSLDRWYKGEYAAARLRLLDYLIEQTK